MTQHITESLPEDLKPKKPRVSRFGFAIIVIIVADYATLSIALGVSPATSTRRLMHALSISGFKEAFLARISIYAYQWHVVFMCK